MLLKGSIAPRENWNTKSQINLNKKLDTTHNGVTILIWTYHTNKQIFLSGLPEKISEKTSKFTDYIINKPSNTSIIQNRAY